MELLEGMTLLNEWGALNEDAFVVSLIGVFTGGLLAIAGNGYYTRYRGQMLQTPCSLRCNTILS